MLTAKFNYKNQSSDALFRGILLAFKKCEHKKPTKGLRESRIYFVSNDKFNEVSINGSGGFTHDVYVSYKNW